ncbi:bifunctional biotin--[acetyl-CoA-carboxylase] ligase/biotin operon repressor BirA [Rheinheimera fenheensis]|uniref:bifunctional biotin--[acetyl-CoA-carboxylase] ligase/biotin operon repressor BirA n=1 Tax=Rheinheimera fenheensis TaxID=3152295 RepID=UPI003260240F
MTKSSLITQRQLLTALSTGDFLSGQLLAERLGVSRTAVANHIKQLQLLGLDIYKVKGRGYRLAAPLNLLDAAYISQLRQHGSPDILVQHITDSTNNQLMLKVSLGQVTQPGYTLVAEAQTAGRGRRGRSWYSPFASSLYFSLYWRLEQGIATAGGLSLVVGIALVRLLRRLYNLDAKIKWPNDIYINDKKVCGILVELSGQANAACDVVIGIGLNIRLPEQAGVNIDQQFTDLASEAGVMVERNQLVAALQSQLISVLGEFNLRGFSDFVDEFNQYNQYRLQQVRLCGNEEVVGICLGVDSQGGLLIQTGAGLHSYFGGELSLRPGV